jgi:hypothetical protein
VSQANTPQQPQLALELSTFNNRGLFADHFLHNRLPGLEEWTNPDGLDAAYDALRTLYRDRAARFTLRTNESQTENDFIRPALNLLWGADCYQVQVAIPGLDSRRQPDYACFCSAADRADADARHGTMDYWRDAPCLADAKAWTASLDKKRSADENPSAQISNYLYRARVRWGILTNGRVWRLYDREKSSAGGIFYEVNLENILQCGNREAFKWFYLFFRRQAILPGPDGKTFLERVFEGSVEYAAEVGDRLKESVYDALRCLMNGLLALPANGLRAQDPDALRRVHENSLIVLYRLLFVLYAEDRGLLNCDDPNYGAYCLRNMHREINRSLRAGRPFMPHMTGLWHRLLNLFRLIDRGYPEGGIPAYNGGLFSPDRHPCVAYEARPTERPWEIGDRLLAETVDLLAYERPAGERAGTRDIDYDTLAVQHLGSIYEGLLELQPRLAEEPMVETMEEGRAVFRPARAVPAPRPIRGLPPRTVGAGEVYLVTNRGERKATGSYYTPKYIVDYIVQNTVGPLTDEAARQAAALRPQVDAEIAKLERTRREWEREAEMRGTHDSRLTTHDSQRPNARIEEQKRRLLEPYLTLKVLDPAMGSGHFLVGAADFLSLAMATDPCLLPLDAAGDEDPQAFYKRLVVERCLYGVDLNPLAVELSKLSLWLHTVSRDRALSFLDHHLRCGNSLIGARIEDDLMTEPPQFNTRGRRVNADGHQLVLGFTDALHAGHLVSMLDLLRQIAEQPTQDAASEKAKEVLYAQLDAVRARFRAAAGLWLAPFFGIPVTPEQYERAVHALRGPDAEWQALAQEPWFAGAQQAAADRRFFHWELEFPEVFFTATGLKPPAERGFDAVIGNPPWGAAFGESDKPFLRDIFETARGKYESYVFFLERKISEVRPGRHCGVIVPSYWLVKTHAEPLRRLLLATCELQTIDVLPEDVFHEVQMDSLIAIFRKARKSKPVEDHLVATRSFTTCPVSELPVELSTSQAIRHIQSQWADNPHCEFIIAGQDTVSQVVCRIERDSKPLEDYVEISQGLTLYRRSTLAARHGEAEAERIVSQRLFHADHKKDDTFVKEIGGSDINRYTVEWDGQTWVSYGPWLAHAVDRKFFVGPRLLVQKLRNPSLATRLVAAYTEAEGLYSNGTLLNLIPKPDSANLFFLLALINSSVCNHWFRTCVTDVSVRVVDLQRLPIRRIAFTTPADERAGFVEEGRRLCEAGDADAVLAFAARQLEAVPERADVLHDLLASLAARMIAMNREKQAETKGFLSWLERTVGAKVDDLTGKTQVRAYHEGGVDDLLAVLRRNRARLAVNPDSRTFQEQAAREFGESMGKLTPLKARLRATDDLIDRLVYRLYGLTEEEIGLVADPLHQGERI